ncbi:MAG TPA: condensation domain-containing protein, partial [Rhodanobacteraceae bacterium]
QRVLDDIAVELALLDLGAATADQREAKIAALVEHETLTPFDLGTSPLWRAFLVREAPDQHVFVFTAHHVVVDGWSSAVIFSDLAKAYVADRFGIPPSLPAAASYRDFVAEQRSPAVAAEMEAALNFWAAQYAAGVPSFELPLDRQRPAFKTYRAGREVLAIDKTLYQSVRSAAAQQGATLFVALLAAFELLIARLASAEDLIIGVPMASQALEENGHLVAHGVNTIPLRCRVDPEHSFAEHLRATRKAFLDAQAHPRLTFGTLVQKLKLPRDPSRTPLVSIVFNIDKLGSPFDFGEVKIAGIDAPKAFYNFELGINAIDDGESLVLECDYNADLFDAATVRRWLSQYRALLAAAAANPSTPLAALSVLTDADRALLIGDGPIAQFDTVFATLHDAFAHQVAATPHAIALSFEDESGRQELSYAELDRRASGLASHLRALGVGPNELVGLRHERSADLVVGLLGILKAGGAYLPLDPVYPTERIAFMLEDARVRTVVTQRALAEALADLPVTCVCLDAPLPAASAPVTRPSSGEDLAYVIYTSGSTG